MNNRNNRRNWIIGLGAIVLVAAALLGLPQLDRNNGAVEAAGPATATVFVGDLETSISTNGNLAPAEQANLTFGINGSVANIYVEAGDTVEAGDVLMELDTSTLELAVDNAEQTVIIRQADYDALRSDELIEAEERVTVAEEALEEVDAEDEIALADAEAELEDAQAELDALQNDELSRSLTIAEAQLKQAENSLASAEADLAKATLTAPFDGIISTVNVQEGEFANGVVISMFDQNSYVVELEIDEIDLRELSEGTDATLTIDALPSVELDGSVNSIAAAPLPNTGDRVTYAVTVELDEYDADLRNGMSTKVWLTTAEREDVVLVPNDAITAASDGTGYYVTILDGDEQVRVEVTIGIRDRQFTEVESGLEAGDEVILRETTISTNEDEITPGGPFGG